MASTVIFLITVLIIFAVVMGIYGIGAGIPQIQNTIDQIEGPWPTISTSNCSFSANGPSSGCNILDTFFLLGIWILASFGSVLFRIGALFYLGAQLISIVGLLSGIPIFGPIFVAVFTIILALFAISHIPGVGKGGEH